MMMTKTIRNLLIIALLITVCNANSQSFLNGDFENNTSTDCDYNIPDSIFHLKMANVYAFGKGYTGNGFIGEVDIQTYYCFVTPQNGSWCIGLASDTTQQIDGDAVAIELSSNLKAGNKYNLSFYIYGNTEFNDEIPSVEVGESLTDSTVGILINTHTPDTNIWKQISFDFIANMNSKYITIKAVGDYWGWVQIDNFTLSPITNLKEIALIVKSFPNPTDSYFSIDLGRIIPKINLSVFNTIGQVVMCQHFDNHQSIKLNLCNIPDGLYYVKIRSEKDDITIKVVKN